MFGTRAGRALELPLLMACEELTLQHRRFAARLRSVSLNSSVGE